MIYRTALFVAKRQAQTSGPLWEREPVQQLGRLVFAIASDVCPTDVVLCSPFVGLFIGPVIRELGLVGKKTQSTVVIVVGTSTITSTYPLTSNTSSASSQGANAANRSTGLSSGARSGIIAGSVVGGVALLTLFLVGCLAIRRRRRHNRDAANNIRWPEIAANPEDRAALYPEQTHATGRAGIGGDDMEEVAAMGAGGAGIGAGAAGRWNSQSTGGRQPTLPQVPPSIYSEDFSAQQTSNGHYAGAGTPYSGNSYTNYSGAGSSAQLHQPLAPGPASIDYHRQTPSPPRNYPGPASSSGHGEMSGPLPLPGEAEHEEIGRPSSPTPMQVGGAFGDGYDETNGGRGWRLSVVNDDSR
ncbi:hypothetical protein RQP46_001218 [Phenoliferia psychrophenolica]